MASPGLSPALGLGLAEAAAGGTLRQGDYLEFGVCKGYAFWHAQHAASRHDAPNLRFFGFDSFAGIPDVEGIDRTDHNEYYKGQFDCSKQQVIANRSEEHTSELQSLMRISYAVFCLKKKIKKNKNNNARTNANVKSNTSN